MHTDKNDVTYVDFNYNWKYCSQPKTDHADRLFSNDSDVVYQWLSVSLPHSITTNKEDNHHASLVYDYWYQKEFDWIMSDEQQVYLLFDSSDDDEYTSNASNIMASIWLNGEKLISNLLLSQDEPIELTQQLLNFCQSIEKNKKSNNILIIRCTDTNLSLHVRLIVHGTMIWTSKQLKINESSLKKKNDAIDYTVRIDDGDRRISVVFANSEEDFESSLPSIPSINQIHVDEEKETFENTSLIPRLTIVILIVGTRGDVQPFIALGQTLLAAGHRVRLATHEVFRTFVRENGLEFFPLAGNPADLMSFMVKNAGIIPSMSSIVAGDVKKHRHILSEILESTWLACTANDDETSLPFTAEAIIANPPSFGHVHCAEKLQIPLHMMFTMPWTPTTTFPHPFCNIDCSRGPSGKLNFYSYHVVEMLTWSGMHGIINHFRKKILGLSQLHAQDATSLLIDQDVPHTYCWSPALVCKPSDWELHIDVSGFFFLDLCTTYDNPPQDLLDFLGIDKDHPDEQNLPSPIYIGFGSITGHDSRRLLGVVLDALDLTGYRAVLSGLATEADHVPKNVFKIGNVPHDWLFQHVSGVCHHGGAGTTAAGLRAGKPTIIVPFFGDQFFWGNVVEKSGAGPRPLPGKSITASELADAFYFAHRPTTRQAAERIRERILKENGCQAAVRSFHSNLPIARMRSHLQSTFSACYRIDGLHIQISRPVAHVLLAAGVIDGSQLRSHHTRKWQLKNEHKSHRSSDDSDDEYTKSHSHTMVGSDVHSRLSNESSTDYSSMNSSPSYDQISDRFDSLISVGTVDSETDKNQDSDASESKISLKTNVLPKRHNRKTNLVNFLKRTRLRHRDSGEIHFTADALIATTKCAIQPAVCALPTSPPWFKILSENKTVNAIVQSNETQHSSETVDTETSSDVSYDGKEQKESNEISAFIKAAVAVSGFTPDICEDILQEFNQIKTRQKQVLPPSTDFKKRSKHKFHFRRQRSRSTSDLN